MEQSQHFIPRIPSDEVLDHIRRLWIIVPSEGKVYSRAKQKEIGTFSSSGYCKVKVDLPKGQKMLKRSHVIWYGAHGEWPSSPVDHINRDQLDDRIENLRCCDHSVNMVNRAYCTDRALPAGVYVNNDSAKYRAVAMGEFLGLFSTIEEAHNAYLQHVGRTKTEHQAIINQAEAN